MVKIFFKVLSAFLLFCLAVCGVGLWVLYQYGRDLPDYRQLAVYEPPVVSRLYAADGRLFAEYAIENRVFVPISAIPRRIVRTFLAAEDKNFYQHLGIDAFGLLRAMTLNLLNAGRNRAPMGASTITQQVAKNFFLSNERSLIRKIKEAILAFRIENTLSKDRILELYLNQIYLGQSSYGVGAAALNYFSKSLDELTIEEAAYLAALPKAPNNYHPVRSPKAALGRRNWVINRMVEEKIISPQEGEKAKATSIVLRQREETEVVRADFFAEEVRRELVTRFGSVSLYQGGLAIKTTLNPFLQGAAERALRTGLIAYDRRHGWRGPWKSLATIKDKREWLNALKQMEKPKGIGKWHLAVVLGVENHQAHVVTQAGKEGVIVLASLMWARRCKPEQTLGPAIKTAKEVLKEGDVILVEPSLASEKNYELCQIPEVEGAILAMDPHTGRVLAMSGGFSFETSQFNRATQALRQPGSAFKPFVYLAALEAGLTPSSIILDAPLAIELGAGLPIWRPQNISKKFYGPVTLRTALEKSYNVSTIRLAQKIGMKRIAKLSENLGVIEGMPLQLAMVLGAGVTTLKKMVAAYSVFVNGGKKINANLVDYIQNRQGKIIYRSDPRECLTCQNQEWEHTEMPILSDERPQVIDPISAYQVCSILEGSIEHGTGQKAKELNRPIAGKTGSTNDFIDAWFIGMTPDLVVGACIFFDKTRTLGAGEVGAKAALPVFTEFAKEALQNVPLTPFRVPSGVKLLKVNHKTGLPARSGDRDVIIEAFKPGTEPQISDSFLPKKESNQQRSLEEINSSNIY